MLLGLMTASRPPVTVDGGFFIMEGGETTRNDCENRHIGVELVRSTFIMNNRLISENVNLKGDAGGVYIGESSIITMNNGNIANNDGGVYVSSHGKFFMNKGVISGNKAKVSGGEALEDKANIANKYGHAVYTINGSKDATAKENKGLDSKIQGPSGGWE